MSLEIKLSEKFTEISRTKTREFLISKIIESNWIEAHKLKGKRKDTINSYWTNMMKTKSINAIKGIDKSFLK